MEEGLRRLNETLIGERYFRIHPSWHAFIKYCRELRFGEIERLKIQDGLPVLAEEVKRKVKFMGQE